MLRIGLTGGIGSGKSTVASLFQTLGVPVRDTDQIAREVVAPGQIALQEIRAAFGEGVIATDGTLDRAKLRSIVFADAVNRRRLEDIMHPRIYDAVKAWLDSLSTPYCVVTVPLLFEAGWQDRFDRILVVDVPEETQLRRTVERDGIPYGDAAAIIATQIGRQTRLAQADDIITNDGDLAALALQVEQLHQRYLALASQQG